MLHCSDDVGAVLQRLRCAPGTMAAHPARRPRGPQVRGVPFRELGTLEAIAGLGAIALLDTRREVDPKVLEAGFLFEPFNAAEPARVLDIASRRMHVDADHL
jgi:hypothetical protein